jgi:integrase/recombinase XerD
MTAQMIPAYEVQDVQIAPSHDDNRDDQLIRMWLHGKAETTQRNYRRIIGEFRAFVAKPLGSVTLGDLQDYADSLTGAVSSQAVTLAAVKSLLGFAHKLGATRFDVGRALKLPKAPSRLGERILDEPTVLAMIHSEPNRRNRAILRTLYYSGCRVSELTALHWRDVQGRDDSGQLVLWGKGGKERSVLLPESVYAELVRLRGASGPDDPVFRSRKGGRALSTVQVRDIVRKAARRVGVDKPVSPHWYRHAHCTHSLERGAPIHLVSATVGHSNVSTTGRYLHARPSDSSARYLSGA